MIACYRIVPGRPGRFHDNGPEQAVDIGAVLAAAGIRHVGEQEDALLIRLPGVADAAAGGGVGIEAHIGAVGGQHVVGKALHVDGRPAAQFVFEVDLNGVAQIRPDDQGPHLIIGLWDGKLKPLPRFSLDALGILLQHIQHPIGVMVPKFVVDDGKGNRFYIIDPELSGARIGR